MESHDAVCGQAGVDSGSIVWHLQDALLLVWDIQETTRLFGYHVALGGGVLNRGYSTKDLDLYFLPLCNENDHDPAALKAELVRQFGPCEPIGKYNGYDTQDDHKRLKFKFANAGKRIDAFIWL